MSTFEINIYTLLDGQHFEELEEKIKELFEKEKIHAEIIDNVTGNGMTV